MEQEKIYDLRGVPQEITDATDSVYGVMESLAYEINNFYSVIKGTQFSDLKSVVSGFESDVSGMQDSWDREISDCLKEDYSPTGARLNHVTVLFTDKTWEAYYVLTNYGASFGANERVDLLDKVSEEPGSPKLRGINVLRHTVTQYDDIKDYKAFLENRAAELERARTAGDKLVNAMSDYPEPAGVAPCGVARDGRRNLAMCVVWRLLCCRYKPDQGLRDCS
jgi:hypothetical protein